MKSVESKIFVKILTATDLNKVRKMYMDETTFTPENSEWLFDGAFGKTYTYRCVGFDYEFPGVGEHYRVYIELQEFKEKTMKHPNYEFIVAFAEGKEVEYKAKGLDGAWDKWEKVVAISKFANIDCYEFRIKPEKKKTVGYRRYVWNSENYGCVVGICYEGVGMKPETIERLHVVLKWIDLEWKYEEVEE